MSSSAHCQGQRRDGFTAATPVSADASIEAKLGKRIDPQPNGCWLWRGTTIDGYGVPAGIGRIHRYVWTTLVGPIPDGMVLHHRCEVRACCNPAHLDLMTAHGHARHHNARLTSAKAAAIIEAHAAGATLSEQARHYGVNRHTIRKVVQGLTWTAK